MLAMLFFSPIKLTKLLTYINPCLLLTWFYSTRVFLDSPFIFQTISDVARGS